MAILISDYTGRQKDLYISFGLDPAKAGYQATTFSFGTVSAYIAGVQKLAQRYLISLFNTGLVRKLQTAQGSNIQDAVHIFNFANWSVIQSFKTYQNEHPEIPDDEQLSTVQLTDISVDKGRLRLSIQLVTKAGANVPILVPIALT
jgi:hypothetical protein